MLLRSLPRSFDSLVSALDSRPDVTLEVVKTKLGDEYGRHMERDAGASGSKPEKAIRSEMNKEMRKCHFCKMPGHFRRNCWKYKESVKNDGSGSRSRKEKTGKVKTALSEVRHVAFTVEVPIWRVTERSSRN